MMNMNDEYEKTEGDAVVTYKVVDVSAEEHLEVAEAAETFVQNLIEGSPFSSHNDTENAGRVIEH